MEPFFRLFSKPTPAQIAGRQAARAWMTILDQTDEELETLTGRDLYNHAQEEARKWLRSVFNIHHAPVRAINQEWDYPEQKHHSEFLQYIEAFVAAFPKMRRGYPKE